MHLRPATAFLLFLLAAPALAEARGEDPKKPRQTLQEFLEHLKQMRDGVQGQLSVVAAEILRALELEAQVRRIAGCEAQRDKLVALGAEAAPLLVDKLEPGQTATDAQKLVSSFVAQALVAIPTKVITEKLFAILKDGSLDGRRNALKVLAVTPEPDRVVPALAQAFRSSQGQVRREVLASLVRIGGAQSEQVVGEALSDPNPEIVRTALAALTESKGTTHAAKVQKLLGASREAVQYLDPLLAYYRACPEIVDRSVLLGFLRVAEDVSVAREARIKLLDGLSAFADKFDSDAKKEVRVIAQAPERELKEAALVLLYWTGDKGARKELLATYDDQIDRNKSWANSYELRANVLYRIGDYRESQRDYLQAINLAKNDVRARLDDAYVGLARCYAQQNRLKEAAQTLEKAPISLKQLAELSHEPVFQKMLENPKYKGVFKVD